MTAAATLPRASRVNAVLARELRSRMRGRRAAVIVTAWLAINAAILWLVYTAVQGTQDDFGFDLSRVSDIGRGVYEWVAFTMLLLLLFLVPAQAAGSVAGERERQTLIPLQVTLMSPWQIMLGKVLASAAFLLLLVVSAMPLLAVAYLIGGVSIGDVLLGSGALLVGGLLLAGMCTAVSALVRKVTTAVVLSYALVLALCAGTFVLLGAAAAIDASRGSDPPDAVTFLLLPNPVVMIADIASDGRSGSLGSPFDAIDGLVDDEGGGFIDVVRGDEQLQGSGDTVEFWMWSLLTLLVLTALFLVVGTRRLRTPAGTER